MVIASDYRKRGNLILNLEIASSPLKPGIPRNDTVSETVTLF
jgi:hypothetical protein